MELKNEIMLMYHHDLGLIFCRSKGYIEATKIIGNPYKMDQIHLKM